MRPLIAGNWKMHGTAPQLSEIARIASVVRMTRPGADIVICPPFSADHTRSTGGRRANHDRWTELRQRNLRRIHGVCGAARRGYEIEDYGAYQVHRAHFCGALATNVVW